jgi:peptidoglycan/LPS O-acetylase OafA/YrhL
VPPYWSVAVEIEMYLLLFLIVARCMAWALVALTVSLSYHLACTYAGISWGAYYFTAPSAVLPFAAGALLYFALKGKFFTISPHLAVAAFIAWFVNLLAGGWIFETSYVFGFGYYLDTILMVIVVGGLAWYRPHPLIRRVDRIGGEWAYFVFLVQWLAGFGAIVVFNLSQSRGWVMLIAATPIILLASAGLAFLNRQCVEPLRDQVRNWQGQAKPAMISLPKF